MRRAILLFISAALLAAGCYSAAPAAADTLLSKKMTGEIAWQCALSSRRDEVPESPVLGPEAHRETGSPDSSEAEANAQPRAGHPCSAKHIAFFAVIVLLTFWLLFVCVTLIRNNERLGEEIKPSGEDGPGNTDE